MIKHTIDFKVNSHGWLLDGRHYAVREINHISFDVDGNFKRCTLTLEIEGSLHKMEISEFLDIIDTIDNEVVNRKK